MDQWTLNTTISKLPVKNKKIKIFLNVVLHFPHFSVSYCIRKPYGVSIKVSCRRLIPRNLSMMPGCLKTQFVGSILTHKGLRGDGRVQVEEGRWRGGEGEGFPWRDGMQFNFTIILTVSITG